MESCLFGHESNLLFSIQYSTLKLLRFTVFPIYFVAAGLVLDVHFMIFLFFRLNFAVF